MKTILITLFMVFYCSLSFAMSFYQAAAEHKINYQIEGNSSGVHYYSPLKITVTNISNEILKLNLDNGQVLDAKEASFQNFIVTKELLAQLKPNEKKEFEIFAMCIEQSDMAPDESAQYTFSNKKLSELSKLTQFIEKNELYNTNSQFLVWYILENKSDYANINDFVLNDFGDIETVILAENDETVQVNPLIKEEEQYTERVLTVSGTFTFNLSTSKQVHIAMFNERNVVVKELYPSALMSSGSNEVDYSFNSNEYPEDLYYIKLVVNGKEFRNSPVDMKVFRN